MIAMIFAAGLGTRLKPLTDTMPKALVPVCDIPLLKIQLDHLYQQGVRKVVVNVHHFADMIIDYLQSYERPGLEIIVSDERTHLLNTGGGLKKAGSILQQKGIFEPLLIHNVDILDNAQITSFYQACSADVDAVLLVSDRKTKRYFLFNDENDLVGWTNVETGEVKSPYENLDVSACKKLAFAGMHVVAPNVWDAMKQFPEEFSIVDFYVSMCKELKIKGYMQSDFQMIDVGKIDSLPLAAEFYNTHYNINK